MAFAEPWQVTQERRKRAAEMFPALGDTDAGTQLQIDNWVSAGNGTPAPVSDFTQLATALGRHAAELSAPEPDVPDAAPNVSGWEPNQAPQTFGEPTYDPSRPDPLLTRTPGLTPLETYQRAQQGSLGFFTGANPMESVRRAGRGLEGEQFSPYDLGFVRNLEEGDPLREPLARIESQLVDPINLATMGQAGAAKAIAVGIGAEEGARALARGFGASPETEATIGAIANIGGNIVGPGLVNRVAPRAATWMEAADNALAEASGATEAAIRRQAPEAFQAGRVPGTDELFTFGPNGESVGPTGAVREIRLGREPVRGENVNRGLWPTNLGVAEGRILDDEIARGFQPVIDSARASFPRETAGMTDNQVGLFIGDMWAEQRLNKSASMLARFGEDSQWRFGLSDEQVPLVRERARQMASELPGSGMGAPITGAERGIGGGAIRSTAEEAADTVTLYRGDAQATGPLSLGKTKTDKRGNRALFFTDSADDAAFYGGWDYENGQSVEPQITEIRVPRSVIDRMIDLRDRGAQGRLPASVFDKLYEADNALRGIVRASDDFETVAARLAQKYGDERGQTVLRRAIGDAGFTGVKFDQANGAKAYGFWDEQAIQRLQRGLPLKPPMNIRGGADLTPDEFARLTAKKAAGEALTPDEQDSVLQALGKAMGATTADEQAAAREALYNGPVPTDMREVDTGLIEGVRRRLGAPTGQSVEDALGRARVVSERFDGERAMQESIKRNQQQYESLVSRAQEESSAGNAGAARSFMRSADSVARDMTETQEAIDRLAERAAQGFGDSSRAIEGSFVEDALRAAREGEPPRVGGGADVPGEPPMVRGGKPTAQTYTAPPTLQRLFGTREIVPGEQRGALERVAEEGRFRADDPIVTPALRVRSEARRAVESQATRVTAQARTALARAFQTDADGRIAALAGIDPDVPGAPTIRDVAARLPRYEASLTAEQRQALQQVRDLVAPYRQALDEVAQAESAITGKPSSIKFGSRADVLDGGFYIPRGTAETEELADIAARRVGRGGGRVGGKQGFEKSATFGSEAEGIEAGYRYTPIDESLASYVRGAGNRALDRHTANYFLTRVDESGQRLAQSRADRAIEANPGLVNEMRGLRQIVGGLRGTAGRLATRERQAVDAFLSGGSNDIDALSDALDQVKVGLSATGAQGRNFGKNREAILQEIEAAQQRIRDIRPEYRDVIQRAQPTPRDRGSIPLAGLDAYAFPYEMADEAARELQKETRNPGTVDAALRAVNGVFRGIQATGEMSYLGIQNAIGTVADPMAGARAAKASTKAWLNAGDEVLGDFISRFDARTAQKGLPNSEQWAASGLRLGGAGTEFRVGGRKLPERVANVVESRPVQIATAPVRSLVKRADRGFGVAGDTMRLELADTLAEEAKLAGRTLDERTMRNIAESANRVTGWTPQRAFGDWGEVVNFAPRYLAARARALGQLASRDPQKRQLARRLVGRYLAIGTAMTVAINELNGEETDYRPFSGKQGPTFDPRKAEYKNPNFMRVMNVAGRDWSLLGPMDALLGTVVGAGSLVTNPTGDPKQMLERVRSIFTAPTASAGLDWMVFGEDFDGNKLTLDSEAGVRDLLGRVLPFATSDLGGSAQEVARQAQEGDIGAAATEAVGGFAQGFVGGRGSRETPREQVERGRYGELTPDRQYQAIPAQSWRLVRESGQDVGGYQTYNQWRTAKVSDIAEYLRGTGVSNAEAKLQAETLVDRLPAAQLYSRLRNSYETMWIAQNAENAGERLDVEVEKPGMERRFTPNQRERQIIEAAR